MSGVIAAAKPHRIKASHRRRWKSRRGQSVQRYYDPSIGRFLSVDPVTADGNTGANFNRYWYTNNNPYRFTDPDGRLGCTSSKIKSVCEGSGFQWQGFTSAGKDKKSEQKQSTTAGARNEGERLTQPYVNPDWTTGPNAHDYGIGPTMICATGSFCNENSVGDVSEFYSVPFNWGPSTGAINILGMDPISHFRRDNISVNITLPGHRFHSGAVIHAAYNFDGYTWLYTRGVGNGPKPLLNTFIGHALFGNMHQNVYQFFNPNPQFP